jgi:Membrane transporters of cations and cationic drugs
MAWTVLILSGTLEAAWATALSKSNGFKKLWPSIIFLVSMSLSVAGLGWAMQTLPTGTAYAVWVGVGASLTVAISIIQGVEKPTVIKLALLVLLVGCVIGLKLVS